MKTMLTKKVPLYLLLLTFFVFLLITIFGFSYLKSNEQVESPEIENRVNPAKGSFCNLNIGRLKGYQ